MHGLQQQIGPVHGVGLLVTTLLGTGIFVVPAMSASTAGDAALFSWILMSIIVLPVALCFARLGQRYPHAGGASHYFGRAFGAPAENIAAWLYVAILPTGMPSAMHVCVSYLTELFPQLSGNLLACSLLILLAMFVLAFIGVKASGYVQTAIALTVAVLFAGLLISRALDWQDLQPSIPAVADYDRISAALAVVFWAFVGIEAIAHLGAEFKNPARDFPITVILGLAIVVCFYFVASALVLKFHAYGNEAADSRSMATVFAAVFGEPGRRALAGVAFACCFAVMNVYMLSLTRMLLSMAGNGVLPEKFSRINARGVPVAASLLTFAIATLAIVIKYLCSIDIQHLIVATNGIFVLIYAMAGLAGVVLLRGFGRYLAVLAVVLCGVILVSVGWSILYALAVLVLARSWDYSRKRLRLTR